MCVCLYPGFSSEFTNLTLPHKKQCHATCQGRMPFPGYEQVKQQFFCAVGSQGPRKPRKKNLSIPVQDGSSKTILILFDRGVFFAPQYLILPRGQYYLFMH